MRNIIASIILWILSSSLTEAEHNSGNSKDRFGKKSDFDSTYNGYLGEYAGQLGAGKATLGELHDYSESTQIAPEHGSQFDEGESHNFSESFGEQNDDEDSSSHFDRYSGSFESLKFPQDGEAHHYSGGVSSDIGSNNHKHHHHQAQHHFEDHNYQFDEPAKSSDFKGYHSFEETQIVPYSGSEEAEKEEEEAPPQYAGYEHSEEENEVTKTPAKSYEHAPKFPASSYSHSFEAPKAGPSSSYSHSFEDSKASTPSKGSPSSYSHFYEASKPQAPSSHHSYSHDSSKIPASSSYSLSFEAPKASSSSYESHKSVSYSHEPSLGSYGSKHQHISVQEVPSSKHEFIPKYKSSGLKDFNSPLHKNIMTINHGKGGYSFSSLYRS